MARGEDQASEVASSGGARTFIPLDATHSSAEAKVYSVMYRETISRELRQRHFSNQDLRKATGLRSDNTVRLALNGLRKKLSIELIGHEKYFPYGQLYRVYTPKEITEARRQANLVIDPKTKQIMTSAEGSAVTSAEGSAVTSATFEGGLPQKLRDMLNTHVNSDDSAHASSSHGPGDDAGKVAEVKKLFEQLANGGRWKDERDATAYAEINHIPLWHIILGLCYSVARSPEHRMSSLAYAVPQILDHYAQMKAFPEDRMLEVAYRTMRRTLNCIETGKWTIAEWERGPDAGA
jgi:hypothetical protein